MCLNLFLLQENTKDHEILLSLKHVRPGKDYEPKFPMFSKIDVNGRNSEPLWQYLRDSLPVPSDNPHHLMADPKHIIWDPVQRNDISWNFEKFLIAPNGIPFKRYSPKFETINIKPDIEQLIKKHKVK